jgi:hypothetical protein
MNDYEIFELKYLEEIYQLYLGFKEISEYNNINLFRNKNDNFMDVFDLIFKSIELIDEDNDILEDNDKFIDQENNSILY